MNERNGEHDMKLEKNRLEALTDGIFAFSMTLLVTSLILPRSAVITDTATEALVSLIPDLYHYVIAFFILAAFWMAHHLQFSHLRFLDGPFIFMNIIGLFFVTLITFTTSFIGDYDNNIMATITFEASLLILGLIFTIQWAYATWNHRLVPPDFPEHRVLSGILGNLVVPSVSLVAIILALGGFHSSTTAYLLLPLVSYGVDRFVKRRAS